MNLRDPDLREALAGEYVLGTLTGAARRRFERAMNADPRLRAEVEVWEQILSPLLETAPEQAPPAEVWAAIEARIEAPSRRRSPPVWSRLWVWRAGAGLAFACAALLAVALSVVLQRPPDVRYVAVMLDAQSRGAWLVSMDPRSSSASVLPITAQAPDAGRVFELWLLPAGGVPRSLGVLEPEGRTAMNLMGAMREALESASGLAVSVEPAGGSPTGQPTGPVRYQGALVKL